MDQFARDAPRPWQRGFTSQAPAILFLNHSELLACFALDWLNGDLNARWWWRALFPHDRWPLVLRRVWIEHARHVPAALDLLDQRQRCAEFLKTIPEPLITEISAQIARVYAVEQSRAALAEAMKRRAFDSPQSERAILKKSREHETFKQPRPWERWAPERSLDIEAECLRVLCLLLVRAPAFIRSNRFIQSAPEAPVPTENANTAVFGPLTPPLRKSDLVLKASRRRQSKKSYATSEILKSDFASPTNESLRAIDDLPTTGQNTPVHTSLAFDESSAARRLIPPAIEEQISAHTWQTHYGGVFYLVNVALALGLYGDFTQPRSASLPLPIWDFLALIGRKFLGPELELDPLWQALAQLAARSAAEPPGHYFQPPYLWRLPSAWLDPFPQKTGWRGGIQNGFVRLEHPAGFTVLDRRLTNDEPTNALLDECNLFGVTPKDLLPLAVPRAEISDASPLDHWQNLLAPYLQARLIRSLGAFHSGPLEQLFHTDASITADTENVIVRFPLATHPIAVRMAGLDRDPGWVPAAARVVRFEYE
jgi:hypothetical protein